MVSPIEAIWKRLDTLRVYQVFCVLVLVTLAVFGNTLTAGFVLDDTAYIVENHVLRDLGNLWKFIDVPADSVVQDLSPGFLKGRNIRWVSFAIDYAIGRGAPWVFHLTNLILHASAAFLLYLLSLRWLGKGWALFAALLFLVHPIQTNAVAYIFGRKDILAALFTLGTLICCYRFRESGRVRWLVVASVAYVTGFLSKENAIVAPVLLLAADVAFWPRTSLGGCGREDWFRSLISRSEYWVLAGVGMALMFRQLGVSGIWAALNGVVGLITFPDLLWAGPLWGPYLVTPEPNLSLANLLLFYFAKLLWPFGLLADYKDVFSVDLVPPGLSVPIGIVGGALILYAMVKSRGPLAVFFFGVAWVIVALLPVCHFVPFHYPVAEHYLYLPVAGFSLSVAATGEKWLSRGGLWSQWVVIGILLALSAGTIMRNQAWQSMVTLTQDILEKAPDHPRAKNTLVHLLAEQGDYAAALFLAEEMTSRNPASAVNWFNLGYLYDRAGDYRKAAGGYRRAIALQNTMWDAYSALADDLFLLGEEAQGWAVLQQLWSRYRYHAVSRVIAGFQELRQGAPADAYASFVKGSELDPALGEAFFGLALVAAKKGDHQRAEVFWAKAAGLGIDHEWLGRHGDFAQELAHVRGLASGRTGL